MADVKTSIEELETLLTKNGDDSVVILPNGEIRAVNPDERKAIELLAKNKDLGGHY